MSLPSLLPEDWHPLVTANGERSDPELPERVSAPCHAKRLAFWGLWLHETLLADIPHRQVVLAYRTASVAPAACRCGEFTTPNEEDGWASYRAVDGRRRIFQQAYVKAPRTAR